MSRKCWPLFPKYGVTSYTGVTSSLCVPSLEWSWDIAKLLGHILITHGLSFKLAVTLGGVAFMGQMNNDTGWWLHNMSSYPWKPPNPHCLNPGDHSALTAARISPFPECCVAGCTQCHLLRSAPFTEQQAEASGLTHPNASSTDFGTLSLNTFLELVFCVTLVSTQTLSQLLLLEASCVDYWKPKFCLTKEMKTLNIYCCCSSQYLCLSSVEPLISLYPISLFLVSACSMNSNQF